MKYRIFNHTTGLLASPIKFTEAEANTFIESQSKINNHEYEIQPVMTPKLQRQLDNWNIKAKALLEGRTIKDVRYMQPDEALNLGLESLCVTLFLDDGTFVYLTSDDEGNDAGVLNAFKKDEVFTLPKITIT